MIFFTVVGLLCASIVCLYVVGLGLIQTFYNDIGGAGSAGQTWFGVAMVGAGLYGLYHLWANLSPFSVVVG